jgi:transketolase
MLGFIWAFSQASTLVEMAETNPDIVIVSQDMGNLSPFTETFPDRIFDVGISESNLIGVAAGLAHAGKLPFVFGMAPFISMRGFEQLRNDCSYNRNNVNIIAPCSGLESGSFGATHHAVEDLGLLRMIPGMTVLCPADPDEGTQAVKAVAEIDGPAYIRFGYIEPIEGYDGAFTIGQAPTLREGEDITIMATGASVSQALKAHDLLKEEGISARVVNMHTLKPIDRGVIEKAARETGCIVTVEEHFITGGLGSAVAEVLAENGMGRLLRMGLRDEFVMDVAPYPDILGLVGLDAAAIAETVKSVRK